jgi:hypothetical protein
LKVLIKNNASWTLGDSYSTTDIAETLLDNLN